MQLMKRMAALGLTVALSVSATTISLSGIVKDSVTGKGLSGVTVSLAKAELSPTATLSNGSWTLSGAATEIAGRHVTAAVSGTSHLSVQEGHVLLRYEGHDLLGHSQPGASAATASATALARSSSVALDTIDTLLFSWQGTVRLRQPLTSYAQSGITTILDTSSTSSAVTGDSGTFTDSRDGQAYKYVKIGTQTWMAQNLNYRNTTGKNDTVGVCYNNFSSNCTTYGRLYTWMDVMNGSVSSVSNPSGVQGICPSGWHVPSDTEWGVLLAYVGLDSARIKLSSTSGWDSCSSCSWPHGHGTDKYGFNVLPAGNYGYYRTFYDLGFYAYFWSSSKNDWAWYRYFYFGYPYVARSDKGVEYGFSLRCLEN